MKRTIPAKEIECCDICGRDGNGLLDTCQACGRRYCSTHRAFIAGCVHRLDVCSECGDNADVLAISEFYAPRISAVLLLRDEALKALEIKYN